MAGFASVLTKEVLILGLLKRGPAYGYRIKQIVKDELEPFAPISSGAVYHTLRLLERKGFVAKRRERDSALPEKQIFEITPVGDETFHALFRLNTVQFSRPQLALDTSLYFLEYVHRERFVQEVKTLEKTLKKYHREAEAFLRRLEASDAPSQVRAIPRHYLAHSNAELGFLAELIEDLAADRSARGAPAKSAGARVVKRTKKSSHVARAGGGARS